MTKMGHGLNSETEKVLPGKSHWFPLNRQAFELTRNMKLKQCLVIKTETLDVSQFRRTKDSFVWGLQK